MRGVCGDAAGVMVERASATSKAAAAAAPCGRLGY